MMDYEKPSVQEQGFLIVNVQNEGYQKNLMSIFWGIVYITGRTAPKVAEIKGFPGGRPFFMSPIYAEKLPVRRCGRQQCPGGVFTF